MNGQVVKCAYCGKERPVSEMKLGKVIFRNSRYIGGRWKQFVDEKVNWYCADDYCEGYNQMAHEG